MNVSFDFYEYAGIIVPGSVYAFCSSHLFPETQSLLGPNGFSLGELGIFVRISYALGHLVQGIGNTIEWIWWLPSGGLPSNQVLRGKTLTDRQHKLLVNRIGADDGSEGSIAKEMIATISREIYVKVAAANRAVRIDKFNGIYGMLRGLSASLITLGLVAAVTGADWQVVVSFAIASIVALRRMHRFGWHYAKELVVTYLSLEESRNAVE